MTTSTTSLTSSIFGTDNDLRKEKCETGSKNNETLFNLFNSSSKLPNKPNKTNFVKPGNNSSTDNVSGKKSKDGKKWNKDETIDDDDHNGTRHGEENKNEVDAKILGGNNHKKAKRRKERHNSGKQSDEIESSNTSNVNEINATNEDPNEKDKKENYDEESRTVFVGNLPLDTTRKSLASLFKSCGKVLSTRLRSIPTAGVKVAQEYAGNQNLVKKVCAITNTILEDVTRKTAQGYVVFESTSSVESALLLNNQIVPNTNGIRLRVDRCKPVHDSTRSVFIGNLPYASDEITLRQHFNNGCGWTDNDNKIEGVRIVRDSATMQCKGFGYILLKDKSLVSEALRLHESNYLKRTLRVMVCGKRTKGRRGQAKDEGKKDNHTSSSFAYKRISQKMQKNESEHDNVMPNNSSLLLKGISLKKKRGVKKIGITKRSGGSLSKRTSSAKKLDKRVKKIQKRIVKGMGKTKK